jgi:MFS transporter, ACS family, D-galactonate transporter
VPIVALAVTQWGWQGGFWVTGVLSGLFAIAFWLWYRNPREGRRAGRLSQAEHSYIAQGGAQREDAVPASAWRSLGYVLRQRKVWGLTLGFAAYGYSFYLLLTWLPGYLETQLHMTVLKSGWYSIKNS